MSMLLICTVLAGLILTTAGEYRNLAKLTVGERAIYGMLVALSAGMIVFGFIQIPVWTPASWIVRYIVPQIMQMLGV